MMTRILRQFALAVVLVAPVGQLGTALAEAAPPETLVAAIPAQVTGPRTDGTFVVWNLTTLGRPEIGAARLADRHPLALSPGPPASYFSVDIDGGLAIWVAAPPAAPRAVQALDLATGAVITVASGNVDAPAVARPWVAWREIEGDVPVVKARDLRTPGAPPVVVQRGISGFSLDGNRVTWLEIDRGARPGLTPTAWKLFTRPLSGGEPVLVAEGLSGGIEGSENLPQSFIGVGDRVVYVLGGATGDLLVTDLRTGERRGLASIVRSATFDGRYIFFDRGGWVRPGLILPVSLWGYDLATDSAFVVVEDVGAFGGRPHARDGVLVWLHGGTTEQMEVHGAPLAAALPSARRAPLAGPAERVRHFPETGHNLIEGFKYFWERNGGLPVFGYPLTEEFQQRDRATGAMRTVQFFERQRFEYHPEQAGTPYEVLLGRLGAEEAAHRGLLGGWAFQPVAATAAHPPGCRYLPETQHRLCGEFRPYWEGRGLELGDPGVSFRESLALFGYPISEEFIDPATGLITQYFERARFEYHPDLAAGQRVLLGRLAADRLAEAGW
jgi:hypothetical protein